MEKLHEHNQRTYENICRMYNEGIQRVAVVQPTGSGKSLLMSKLIEDNPGSRFFVLSTSHKINDQFKSKLDEESLKRIDFNIYCNMPNMNEDIMKALQPDYILLDEMHRALAKEWSKGINVLLEMYPNAKVLGLSATPIRYLDRCRNVVEELFGGNLACDMSLSQAILDGVLPMARYVCGVYSYEKDSESLNRKIEKSCNSDEEKKELMRELKVLKENLDKGHGVSDIFRKYIISGSEKFVVFLKNTKHLGIMKPVIEKWFTDAGFNVHMYEVHSKNADRDKEFQAFKEDKEDGIVKLCLSVAMLTEGIHGDISGVIMLRNTISPNMYFQMIGRAFSCGKKTIPLIIDLVANSQFISDAVDNFPNELRGEIEKRKEEYEKEGKEYEVGFEVDEFIVMDEFMDVISGFKAIEGRLQGSWDLYIKALKQYKEREGDCDIPYNHIEVMEGIEIKLGQWCQNIKKKKRAQLTKDQEEQLEQLGFIWDKVKYRFECNVNQCIRFYENNGRKPSTSKKSSDEERKLGIFWNSNAGALKLPSWKIDLLERIPYFFCKKNLNCFDKFYECALVYKEKYGNLDIKKGTMINERDVYQLYYYLKSRRNKLRNDQLKLLKDIGIDLNFDKVKDSYDQKMELAKQAVNEGVIINAQNQMYKGINFYTWKSTHLSDFTKEEKKIIDRLIPSADNKISVQIIDAENKKVINTYTSINEAGRALYKDFHIVENEQQGSRVIFKRLAGRTKNPIYKGFCFKYVDSKTI